jgi:hypothetical protein
MAGSSPAGSSTHADDHQAFHRSRPFHFAAVPPLFEWVYLAYCQHDSRGENMSGRAKVVLIIAGFALTTRVAAQTPGPPPTAFDGRYVRVSAHIAKSTAHGRQCPPQHAPDTLTIANGVVQSSARQRWTGTVGPQGDVVLRNKLSMRVDAQIDPQGAIKGLYQGPACMVNYVWHKQQP